LFPQLNNIFDKFQIQLFNNNLTKDLLTNQQRAYSTINAIASLESSISTQFFDFIESRVVG